MSTLLDLTTSYTPTAEAPRAPKPTPKPDIKAQAAAMFKMQEALSALVQPATPGLSEEEVIELIKAHVPVKVNLHRVEVKQGETVTTSAVCHKNTASLIRKCSARDHQGNRLNVWLVGPAGTGKTTAAHMVAKSLGLEFRAMGAISDPIQLTGYVSPVTGNYMRTPFRDTFEHGGVILLDEIDGSDPNAMLVVNQALANGTYGFPDGLVQRHRDCLVIAAANTWGLGATPEYVGRLKADAAFLDRFVYQDWPIDEDLELATCPDSEWCHRVQNARKLVKERGIRVLITPRASYYGAALLAAGCDQAEVDESTLRKGMTPEQWGGIVALLQVGAIIASTKGGL